MGLAGFERRIERMVEGVFGRLSRSGVRPVELGRRLVREMDLNRTVDVSGRLLAPNAFTIRVSPEDQGTFAEIEGRLRRELMEAAREHGRDEDYTFAGPIEVAFEVEDRLRPGSFAVEAAFHEAEGAVGPATLVLPTGDRVPLGELRITIGRQTDCTIVLADPNVSRHHAEVRPDGDGFAVVDLGSTNGTRVNGARVDGGQRLAHGDELRFGNTVVRYESA